MRRLYPALALISLALPAQAATVLHNSVGEITGARNVIIGGVAYDVELAERGSCFDLFDGCDAQSDFLFRSAFEATAASYALLNQVFGFSYEALLNIEGMTGDAPQVWTPYNFFDQNGFRVVNAGIVEGIGLIGGFNPPVFLGTVSADGLPENMTDETFAQWSLAAAPSAQPPAIPLHGSIWFMIGSITGLAALRKRSQRSRRMSVGSAWRMGRRNPA